MALIERAGFFQFRNLADGEMETSARQVFFIGENGQGKTNLLEALYVLLVGSSFRTRRDRTLARKGKDSWSVRGKLSGDLGGTELQVKHAEGKKAFFIDGFALKERKDLLLQQSVVLFSHDDFILITGPTEERRRFFDQTAIMISTEYLVAWRRYQNFLRQRNESLRGGLTDAFLDIYEQQMEEEAEVLCGVRQAITQKMAEGIAPLFEEVSRTNKKLTLEYLPDQKNWEPGVLRDLLKKNRLTDREFGFTRRGPHRDKWRLDWAGENFQERASTGQIRLASLCLKSVQAAVLTQETGKKPIFLLDDVLLELDGERRERFSKNLPGFEQAFYTFLPGQQEERFMTNDAMVYTLKEGSWTNKTTFGA